MILLEITTRDIVITAIMAYLAFTFYFLSGLRLVIKKDQNNVSKKYKFMNPEKFVFKLGLIEIISSVTSLIIFTIGLIVRNIYLPMLIASGSLLLVSIVFEFALQRRNKM